MPPVYTERRGGRLTRVPGPRDVRPPRGRGRGWWLAGCWSSGTLVSSYVPPYSPLGISSLGLIYFAVVYIQSAVLVVVGMAFYFAACLLRDFNLVLWKIERSCFGRCSSRCFQWDGYLAIDYLGAMFSKVKEPLSGSILSKLLLICGLHWMMRRLGYMCCFISRSLLFWRSSFILVSIRITSYYMRTWIQIKQDDTRLF